MSSFKVKGQIKVNVLGGHLSLTVTALVCIFFSPSFLSFSNSSDVFLVNKPKTDLD